MAVSQWKAGELMTADRINQMLPRWTAWTPTWSTSTGSGTPTFGNATIDCKYAQAGDVVYFNAEITFGSTTNFGGGGTSDNWRFSLPVTAAETVFCCGFGEAQDTSVAGSLGRVGLRVRLTTTTEMELEISTGRPDAVAITNGGLVDLSSPWTWANGDFIRVSGHYQAA